MRYSEDADFTWKRQKMDCGNCICGENSESGIPEVFRSVKSILDALSWKSEGKTVYTNVVNGDIKGHISLEEWEVQVEKVGEEERLIACHPEKCLMYVLESNATGYFEWRSPQIQMGIIDLDLCGTHWEGGVWEASPCGYGKLYSEENNITYEGFMYQGKYVGVGRVYYDGVERIQYSGSWWNSEKFGEGVLYDRNGGEEYRGSWYENLPIPNAKDSLELFPWISCSSREVQPSEENLCNLNSVDWIMSACMIALERIELSFEINENCFNSIRIEGLLNLNFAQIGDSTFGGFRTGRRGGKGSGHKGMEKEKYCCIRDCPHLKELIIGRNVCGQYSFLQLTHLDCLETITIGRNNFTRASSFCLAGE